MKKNINSDNFTKLIANKLRSKNRRSNGFNDKLLYLIPSGILVLAVLAVIVFSVIPKEEQVHVSQELYNAYGNENSFKNRVYGESQTPNMENEPTPSNEDLPISVYGDSYCVAYNAMIPSFPAYLSKYTNSRLVYNVAAPEDSIEMVAARTGGVSMYVSPCDIKKDKENIEITLSNKYGTNLIPDFSKNAGLNPCKIDGIEGVISINNGKLYFSRSKSGFENIITSPTPVITRAMDLRLNDITVIFVGSDKLYNNTDKVIEIYQKITENLGTDKYLIIGPVYGSADTIANANTELEQAFGKKYFNLFDYLCSDTIRNTNGLELPDNEIEKADNKIEIPATLLNESKEYFTETGNDIVGQAIADKLSDLGYLS